MNQLRAGQSLGPETYRVTREDLVRYAAASGDSNPIHVSDQVARQAGLPGVVAHGMYTLALAGRAVSGWVDDPAAVRELAARFTRPVVVPDGREGTHVEVAGTVTAAEGGRATIELSVSCDGARVLGRARAVVAVAGDG